RVALVRGDGDALDEARVRRQEDRDRADDELRRVRAAVIQVSAGPRAVETQAVLVGWRDLATDLGAVRVHAPYVRRRREHERLGRAGELRDASGKEVDPAVA